MALSLTEDEKARILRFLGYPNWQSLAQSFQLGFPSEGQPEFLVRLAFDRIDELSVTLIRKDLCQLEAIECELIKARENFVAKKIGELTIDPKQQIQLLEKEEARWKNKLADDLGVYENPWSNFNMQYGGNGRMNAKVYGS